MKKEIYIFILALLVSTGFRAQDSAWVRTYGGPNLDVARDVKEVVNDRGFAVAGTTSSFGQGNTSMYLVKTDSMGIHQWSRNYGGLNSDWACSLEATLDNGFLLAGFSNSFSATYDPYVVKTDGLGNVLWQRTYGTDDWDFIYGSVMLPDSGFVLCGETYGNAIGGSDGYVIRIDKAGNQVWAVNVGSVNDDKLNKIILVNNVLCAVGSTVINGHQQGLLVKMDLSGNTISSTPFNNSLNANQEFLCITATSTFELVMGGYVHPDSMNCENDWLIKIDQLGNSVFNYSAPGYVNSVKRYEDVVTIEFDEIVFCGTSTGGNGGLGLFMSRFNSSGFYLAADAFGGFNNDRGYGLALTQTKHLIFVGSTESFGCGDQDMYFIKNRNQHFGPNSKLNNKYYCDTLGLAVVDLREEFSKDLHINCFPNPFADKLTIDLNSDESNDKAFEFKMRDISGRLIFRTKLYNGANDLSIQNIESGMYFYSIWSDGNLMSSGKLIQQ